MNSNQQMTVAKQIIDQIEDQMDYLVRNPQVLYLSPVFRFRKLLRDNLIHNHHMDVNQANYVATRMKVDMEGDIADHVIEYLAHEYAILVIRAYEMVEGDGFAEEVILNNLEIEFKVEN